MCEGGLERTNELEAAECSKSSDQRMLPGPGKVGGWGKQECVCVADGPHICPDSSLFPAEIGLEDLKTRRHRGPTSVSPG